MAEQRQFDVIEEAVDMHEELFAQEEQEVVAYQQPMTRLERITKIEKAILATLVVFFVALSALTIQISNRVAQYEEKISSIKVETDTINTSVTELQQEKTELSRVDKLNDIADKYGLSKNEDNIRNVTE